MTRYRTQNQIKKETDRIKISTIPDRNLDPAKRVYIIAAALLALFLGAMDALIVSAAMPTIVAELGSMHLYSWVYSVYFLARAVSLPIFGKLADLYKTRTLFIVTIAIFITASVFFISVPNGRTTFATEKSDSTFGNKLKPILPVPA